MQTNPRKDNETLEGANKIIAEIGKSINSIIEDDWSEAWIEAEMSDDTGKFIGKYKKEDSNEIFDFLTDVAIYENFEKLREVTKRDNENSWKRAKLTLTKSGQVDIDFDYDRTHNKSIVSDSAAYRELVNTLIDLLEELAFSEEIKKDTTDPDKYYSQLRLAERTFNFLLDRFPKDKVKDEFTMEGWNEIKNRRDHVASEVAKIIDSNPNTKKRFEGFCDNLKNLGTLGTQL